MATAEEIQKYREFLQEEVDGIFMYRVLHEIEEDEELKDVYGRLITTEERHLKVWQDQLRAAGADDTPGEPTRRARILMWIARKLGTDMVLPVIKTFEMGAEGMYAGDAVAEQERLPEDERQHARVFNALSDRRGAQGSVIGRVETRHRALGGGNALRASVLGANDGLVSNLALVMGVAGANPGRATVLLAGFAGLLAGASSMALGEWISVTTSREAAEAQIAVEEEEIRMMPEAETEELALIYQAKGLPRAEAESLAASIMADPETALATLAREELGVVPEDLGSPWAAAIASFLLFSLGAILPVLPYLFLTGWSAVGLSALFSSIGLFILGAGMTLLTGRNPWYAGMRQVSLGIAAAVLTYGVGSLIGGVAGI
ncbi:MAG: VIT1/CCC1 transporter family protein [Dehalococcoidia bacterium]